MPPGHGLALTLVLSRATLGSPQHITRLSLLVAVELRRVLASNAPPDTNPTVKWPNDVHIQGRKVAGILVETLDDDRLGIGIGINLTGVPPEVPAETATCIAQHHIDITSAELVAAITDAIILRAPELDSDTLLDELAATIDTIGREVRLELPDGRFLTGKATGIGQAGSLIVDVAGNVHEFTAADVTHLRIGGDERR
jgi:BirA family biotin operon repressor/biotin-[acetyl-CoA-carboxylase] ligase